MDAYWTHVIEVKLESVIYFVGKLRLVLLCVRRRVILVWSRVAVFVHVKLAAIELMERVFGMKCHCELRVSVRK